MKYVITNADDYGYRPVVSNGIIKSHKEGLLTSTSVLVNSITDEEVNIAKQNTELGLGLHLNITSGKPLSQNWLEKYGELTRPKRNQPEQFYRGIWLSFFERFETEDIYIEYKAQMEKFIGLFGLKPTHLDSHHYTSSFDKVFPAFVKIAKEYNLPVRRQVMFDYKANQHPMGNIDFIGDKNIMLEFESIKTTDYFSLLYFNRYENYLDVVRSELRKIKDGQSIELSWHPGFEEEWREQDLSILVDPSLKLLFEDENCRLVNFNFLKD